MGFFGALGRALAGKQPYGPTDKEGQTDEPASQLGDNVSTELPAVHIGRVESRVSGQRIDVYADVENESSEPLFLDRVFVAGVKRELDSQLGAGQGRQFVIYSGPLFTRQPNGYVELQYRKQSDGDYFANKFTIRSRQEGGEGFVITECLPAGPVKDI